MTKKELETENAIYKYWLKETQLYLTDIKISPIDFAKKLKALEIIREKIVTMSVFYFADTVQRYNELITMAKPLSEEEFDLLKEVLK